MWDRSAQKEYASDFCEINLHLENKDLNCKEIADYSAVCLYVAMRVQIKAY